jgi:hypothetical protein
MENGFAHDVLCLILKELLRVKVLTSNLGNLFACFFR